MDELEPLAASNTSEVSPDSARHSNGDDLTDDPMIVRFLAVALIPVAGLVAWYLLFGLNSYSSVGILAPAGVAVVVSFLANAIWPVCVKWQRACWRSQ